jgi:hypothetical protein
MSRDELVRGWCELSICDIFGNWTKKLRLELVKIRLGYI